MPAENQGVAVDGEEGAVVAGARRYRLPTRIPNLCPSGQWVEPLLCSLRLQLPPRLPLLASGTPATS